MRLFRRMWALCHCLSTLWSRMRRARLKRLRVDITKDLRSLPRLSSVIISNHNNSFIVPDGSYGTETIVLDDPAKAKLQSHAAHSEENLPLRRALITTEDDYLASCLAVTLTKLAIKSKKNLAAQSKHNQLVVDSILIICALLKGDQQRKKHADPDSKSRMQLCLRVLSNPLGLQSLSAIESIIVD